MNNVEEKQAKWYEGNCMQVAMWTEIQYLLDVFNKTLTQNNTNIGNSSLLQGSWLFNSKILEHLNSQLTEILAFFIQLYVPDV